MMVTGMMEVSERTIYIGRLISSASHSYMRPSGTSFIFLKSWYILFGSQPLNHPLGFS